MTGLFAEIFILFTSAIISRKKYGAGDIKLLLALAIGLGAEKIMLLTGISMCSALFQYIFIIKKDARSPVYKYINTSTKKGVPYKALEIAMAPHFLLGYLIVIFL